MQYSITSLDNWKKFEETGDNELLNDVHYWLERGEKDKGKMSGDYRVVIAWEGGSVQCRILE